MGKFKRVIKKIWTKDDLLKIAGNEFERNAVEYEFEKMATKNSAGELAIDFRGEVNGTWLLINLQAMHLEHLLNAFLSEKGYDFKFRKGDFEDFHEFLTRLLGGLYI